MSAQLWSWCFPLGLFLASLLGVLLSWRAKGMTCREIWSHSPQRPSGHSLASLFRAAEMVTGTELPQPGREAKVSRDNLRAMQQIKTESGEPFMLAAGDYYTRNRMQLHEAGTAAVMAFYHHFEQPIIRLSRLLGVPHSEGLGIALAAARSRQG